MDFRPLDALMTEAVQEGVFPSAAYAVGVGGEVVHRGACGDASLDTLWDLASLTKTIGTTTAGMVLFDRGKLDLDQPVAEILPESGQNDKSKITFRNLLRHDSGLAAFRHYDETLRTPGECLAAIFAETLEYPTGTKTVYSDLGMITFGKAIEVLAGRVLDEFLAEEIFQPLGMSATQYNPGPQLRERCAPTEKRGGHWIVGEVHDPTAWLLGGVAGHAGLFSTLDDVCKFMRAMVSGGNGLVKESTIKLFTRRQSPESSRALGWDTPSEGSSAGTLFPADSFGHTGFTGTSVWGSLSEGLFGVLLSNRVHPTAENVKILAFRRNFYDVAYRMVHA